jgi:hypothetical protein
MFREAEHLLRRYNEAQALKHVSLLTLFNTSQLTRSAGYIKTLVLQQSRCID